MTQSKLLQETTTFIPRFPKEAAVSSAKPKSLAPGQQSIIRAKR